MYRTNFNRKKQTPIMEKDEIRKAVERYCRRNGIEEFRPRAALIDMDGTLIDSMRNHTASWKRLADKLGIQADRDEFYLYEGMTGGAPSGPSSAERKDMSPTTVNAMNFMPLKRVILMKCLGFR